VFWLKKSRASRPQRVNVQTIIFIGEQDGPPERELKTELTALFGQLRLVTTAYLARVRYGDAGTVQVALCVRGQPGQNRMFAERVNRIFGPMFGSHEHLDIIWVTPEEEPALRSVCRPFYALDTNAI